MNTPDLSNIFGKVESEKAALRILEEAYKSNESLFDVMLDVDDFKDRHELVGFVCLAEDGYVVNVGGTLFEVTQAFIEKVTPRLEEMP